MAGGECDWEASACSGAARLTEGLVDVAVAVAFVVAKVGPADPTTGPGIDAVAIRLNATTCERDCILCCCSAGIAVAVFGGAVVVVEDNEEEDVAFPLVLVLIDALAF